MTAEDVVFTFSRERMFGNTEAKNRSTLKAFENIPTPRPGKELPAEIPAVARRAWPDLLRVDAVDRYTVRFYNATPDVTLEGRLARYGSDIMSRAAGKRPRAISTGPASRSRPAPTRWSSSARTIRSRSRPMTTTGAAARR
jgi:ABC-type transport system substrate-binding protein